jgi:16S rRNA (uracil1498-N3)-methyltransferase
VERSGDSAVNTFFVERVQGGVQELGGDAAHHARVKRLEPNDRVQLTDGQGTIGLGLVIEVTKSTLVIGVNDVRRFEPPAAIRLCVPVADKERMLWAAEKATELQIAEWIPVMYERSKSVNPRGEGESFDKKVLARMVSALEQAGSAWLPVIHPVRAVEDLLDEPGVILEQNGKPLGGIPMNVPFTIAVGPEGGFTPAESASLRDRGWTPASLGSVTLRFETAAIGAVAIARALIT